MTFDPNGNTVVLRSGSGDVVATLALPLSPERLGVLVNELHGTYGPSLSLEAGQASAHAWDALITELGGTSAYFNVRLAAAAAGPGAVRDLLDIVAGAIRSADREREAATGV